MSIQSPEPEKSAANTTPLQGSIHVGVRAEGRLDAGESKQGRLRHPPGSWIASGACSVALLLAFAGLALQKPALGISRANAPFDAGWFLRPFEVGVTDRAGILPDLYAVAANSDGQRVWAAGAGPSIWHSADSGRTWKLQAGTDAGTNEILTPSNSWLPISTAQAAAERTSAKRVTPEIASSPQAQASTATSDLTVQRTLSTPSPASDASPNTARPEANARSQPVEAAKVPPASAFRSANQRAALAPNEAPTRTPKVPQAASPISASGASSAASATSSAYAATPVQAADSSSPRNRAFLALQMSPDGLTGWAVGTDGRAMYTDDGGTRWESRNEGLSGSLRAVVFDSPDDVWIGGDGGRLMRSFDQGRHWSLVYTVPSKEPVTGLALAGNKSPDVGLWLLCGDSVSGIIRDTAAAKSDLPAYLASGSLSAISVEPSRNRAIAIGGGATLIANNLAGGEWRSAPAASAPMEAVADLSVYTVAVGPSGIRLFFGLDDLTWRDVQINGPPATLLHAVSFSDKAHGWTVGQSGRILTTEDGGRTWSWLSLPSQINEGSYQSFPPPWTLLLALAALSGLGYLLRGASFLTKDQREKRQAALTKNPGLLPDAPVADLRHDRLGHARAVRALDGFIRNVDTDPRLTIAITAPWGQGKSSVMRMLQTQLEAKGYRSAWFNAWHHQQEGRALSALFTVIASQALPPVLPTRLWLRARLIWMRGFWYRALVLLTVLVTVALITDIRERLARPEAKTFWETAKLKFAADVLGQPRLVLTTHSLDLLNPCSVATSGAASGTSAGIGTASAPAAVCTPCSADRVAGPPARAASGSIRPNIWCYAKQNLQWQNEDGRFTACRRGDQTSRCEFSTSEDLFSTIERGSGMTLTPEERHQVTTAAEPLPPPELLPFTEKVVPVVILILGLLITKGVSVYGFELLKPLRLLVSPEARPQDGKEATGSIERYRVEFSHLADALRGRLVIFIDDLDRCSEEMVNSVLEMSNYLTDVGDCYIVMGADLSVVKQCIRPPGAKDYDETYANRYLRKLIHVELPVPLVSQVGTSTLVVTTPKTPGSPSPSLITRDMLRRWTPAVSWLAATVFVICAGEHLVDRYDSREHGSNLQAGVAFNTTNLRDTPPPAAISSSGATAAPASTAAAASPAPSTANNPLLHEVLAKRGVPQLISVAISLLLLASPIAALLLSRKTVREALKRFGRQAAISLGAAEVTRDSADVEKAMQLWHRLVYAIDNTPRGAKRFRNKARLFGMLLADEFPAAADSVRVDAVALVALSIAEPAFIQRLAISFEQKPSLAPEARLVELFWNIHADEPTDPEAVELHSVISDCISEHGKLSGEFIRRETTEAFLNWARSIAVR